MLLGKPWIHNIGVITSPLHQYLKYIMNEMLVTVKVEKTISIEDCTNRNIHVLEIVNTKCVPENTMPRKLKISKVVKMTTEYFNTLTLECRKGSI